MTTIDAARFVRELDAEIRTKRRSMLDAEFLEAVESRSLSRDQIGAWRATV